MAGQEKWDLSVDVVVVGGGAAGLPAAMAAHDHGAEVLVLEAAAVAGGTAAWAGGGIWVPLNRHEHARGIQDSKETVLGYMRTCAGGTGSDEQIERYATAAVEVFDYLEAHSPLKLTASFMPDYQQEIPGWIGKNGESRSVGPDNFNMNDLGARKAELRRSWQGPHPYNFVELATGNQPSPEQCEQRLKDGIIGWGEALAGSLFSGVLQRGIDIRTKARGRHVVVADGRVAGVVAEIDGKTVHVEARRGVVLATGGYEWDRELAARYFPAIDFQPASVPTNRGDGFRMAEEAGADLGNLGAWWGWPGFTIPGHEYEGHPVVYDGLFERQYPHLIMVDAKGERFVDECTVYHTIQKVLVRRDAAGRFIHQPAFYVFDQQYRDRYPFGPAQPGTAAPDWLKTYPTLDALAAANGIDPAGLRKAVDRWNGLVRSGRDEDFQRGETAFGRFFGDPANGPLGTVEKAPFHCYPVTLSTLGTCGGPRTDAGGAVLKPDGNRLPGLYAAGNVTAAMSGDAYFGPGGTLGPAIVFGFLAGKAAAEARS